MTPPVRLLILIVCSLLPLSSLMANPVKTYQSSAFAPILENDIAFAKHNAFQKAQQAVMAIAIQDLLDPRIYAAHRNQIYRRPSLKPKNHLVSVKILNEYAEDGEFTIELEAKIQINSLISDLRQMGLVFKSDPWFPITLLIESGITADTVKLKKSLAPFHIEINTVEQVDFTGISTEEKESKIFIEDLFLNYSHNGIIYVLETAEAGDKKTEAPGMIDDKTDPVETDTTAESVSEEPTEFLIKGIQLRIIRRSDLAELNRISLNFNDSYPPESEEFLEAVSSTLPRLYSLLTTNSVKRNTYESGLSTSYQISVSGLNAPYMRSAFELQILKNRRTIKSYSLIELSKDTCRYIIKSSTALDALAKDLLKPNPYFELTVETTEFNTIGLSAFYQYTATGSDPEFWESDNRVLDNILNTLVDAPVEGEEEQESPRLNSYYIPSFIEVEPNNSIIQFNRIPSSTYILGEISSRADEDIFELKGIEITDDQLETELFPNQEEDSDMPPLVEGQPEHNHRDSHVDTKTPATVSKKHSQRKQEIVPVTLPMSIGKNATVYIDWIQIGKTSLAPQLKLYDESFNFINAFNLVRSQKRLRFHYTFPEAAPERIYIRISDRIGFIQGETGGFKRYQYLIRYSWNNEDEEEPEKPLVLEDEESATAILSE